MLITPIFLRFSPAPCHAIATPPAIYACAFAMPLFSDAIAALFSYDYAD